MGYERYGVITQEQAEALEQRIEALEASASSFQYFNIASSSDSATGSAPLNLRRVTEARRPNDADYAPVTAATIAEAGIYQVTFSALLRCESCPVALNVVRNNSGTNDDWHGYIHGDQFDNLYTLSGSFVLFGLQENDALRFTLRAFSNTQTLRVQNSTLNALTLQRIGAN